MVSTQPQSIVVEPNQFLLGGYDLAISYETTSFTGTPRFSYTRHGQTIHFIGEEIQIDQTPFGQTVTVNFDGNQKAAGGVETLTVLIPAITVPITTREGPIQTLAIFSLRSSLIRISGQSQQYMPLCLSGKATQIFF